MKSISLWLTGIFCLMISIAQAQDNTKKTLMTENSNRSILPVRYRIFPTKNMWTFLKLDTQTGRIWQIQYDIKDRNRHETVLSTQSLVTPDETKDDRFTLYPTQNIWTFILLDQLDGRVWQVQWSNKMEDRMIQPINGQQN